VLDFLEKNYFVMKECTKPTQKASSWWHWISWYYDNCDQIIL